MYTKKMRLINGKLWSYLSKIWLMRRFVSVLIDASSHDKFKSWLLVNVSIRFAVSFLFSWNYTLMRSNLLKLAHYKWSSSVCWLLALGTIPHLKNCLWKQQRSNVVKVSHLVTVSLFSFCGDSNWKSTGAEPIPSETICSCRRAAAFTPIFSFRE